MEKKIGNCDTCGEKLVKCDLCDSYDDEGRCPKCDNWYQCKTCKEYLCDLCYDEAYCCDGCNSIFCDGCANEMNDIGDNDDSGCDDFRCEECNFRCSKCGLFYCERHMHDNNCCIFCYKKHK